MKERNTTIDIIRGFAMLLVVLEHTMSGTVSEYSDSMLFQVAWTLQIPLFILISGYVTRYSKPISNGKSLWKFIKKRTLAYLLPWTVWTIIVRGLIFGETNFLNLKYLLWHMDSGYWFLATIWTISMIYGISDVLSNFFFRRKSINVLSHLLLTAVAAMPLVIVGRKVGLDFFSIKLSLYYLTFYMLGYLFGQCQDLLLSLPRSETVKNCLVVVSLGIWLSAISRIDFYSTSDELILIIARFATSLLGCVAVMGLASSACKEFGGGRIYSCADHLLQILKWVGTHSLEVYLIHGFSLNLLTCAVQPALHSAMGVLLIIANFFIAVVLSCIYIKIIEKNIVLNKILFWK